MIEQRRLSHYDIDVSKADFNTIRYDEEKMPMIKEVSSEKRLDIYKNEIAEIKKRVFGKCSSTYLPEQISLLDGFIHLSALRDEIMMSGSGDYIGKLKRLRSVVYLRNNSIFAHGFSPVSREDYEKFKEFVLMLFRQFCELEQIDYTEYSKKMEWVNPLETGNYSLGVRACQ